MYIKIHRKALPKGTATRQISENETVHQFAEKLNFPTSILVNQLIEAGVDKRLGDDLLTEQDKTSLLLYLRTKHTYPALANLITITKSPVGNVDPILDRENALKITNELKSLDNLRDYYFEMQLVMLNKIWNKGDNDIDEVDRQIVRAAIRSKCDISGAT